MKLTLTQLALAILLVACATEPEQISPTQEDTNARTQYICAHAYKWSTPTYPQTSADDNEWHYYVDAYPHWTLGCNNIINGGSDQYNCVINFRMQNTGPSPIRFRKDGGAWITLASGQQSIFSGTSPIPGCNTPYAHIAFSIDVERTSCVIGASGYIETQFNLHVRTINNTHEWVYHPLGSGWNCNLPGNTVFGASAIDNTCN
jgi:uncharacterized protein YceK